VRDRKALRLPWKRYLPDENPVNSILVELWQCETGAPSRKTSEVSSLCRINVDLPPWNELPKHTNNDLVEYRVVQFELQMTPTGNALDWSVLIDGQLRGEKTIAIEYPGTTSASIGFNRSPSGISSPPNGFSSPSNGFSSPPNGFSSPTNRFSTSVIETSSQANGFHSQVNGFHSHANSFSSQVNGSSSQANGFSSPAPGPSNLANGFTSPTNGFSAGSGASTTPATSPSYPPPPIPASTNTMTLSLNPARQSRSTTPEYPQATATGFPDPPYRATSPIPTSYRESSPSGFAKAPSTASSSALAVLRPQGSPRPAPFLGTSGSMAGNGFGGGTSLPPVPPIPPIPRPRSSEFAEVEGSGVEV
jgi:hypothetical protein